MVLPDSVVMMMVLLSRMGPHFLSTLANVSLPELKSNARISSSSWISAIGFAPSLVIMMVSGATQPVAA